MIVCSKYNALRILIVIVAMGLSSTEWPAMNSRKVDEVNVIL